MRIGTAPNAICFTGIPKRMPDGKALETNTKKIKAMNIAFFMALS